MTQPQIINGMTFEMAQTMVQGSKHKALRKFKQFCTPAYDYDDMLMEADIAIAKAWREWDPSKTKFNTHATNMINWLLYRALDTYNPVFKMNFMTKNDLKAQGETFATLNKKRITLDEEFNKEHDVDGIKPFDRTLFNKYVYHTSNKTFGVVVLNQSQFANDADEENFDILDTVIDDTVDDAYFDVEIEHDMYSLGKDQLKIVMMLRAGEDLPTISKAMGMSKTAIMRKFANTELYPKKVEEMA
jgi:DNA-directed RNA polymerase specialized sigma subunit